jgi:signal transduction histidine kinase
MLAQISSGITSQIFKRCLIVILLYLMASSIVYAESESGFWLESDYVDIDQLLADSQNKQIKANNLSLTGGQFWHQLPVTKNQNESLVIDFQNSSVIGLFTHYVVNSDQQIVATYDGGIQSQTLNPYLLRHGRNLDIPEGQYIVYTRMTSPFLLAQPKPVIFEQSAYILSIKTGNSITLIGLGIFFALGLYYIVLGITRRQPTDYLYATFILANFVYNGTALNVFSDIFRLPIFYSIGFPIMLSNMAYIAFVMALLKINKKRTPILFRAGQGSLILLGAFWLIAPFVPNFSLEFARYGVGLFGIYGVTAGIVMAIRGVKTARYYLIANIAFIIPGIISILLQSLPNSTMFIEHIGLFAVSVEVILLSLVLSYQLSVVYKEKAANLLAAEEALKVADVALKAKERFLANISHELRTPLNAIQGSVELLSARDNEEESRENIEVIRHSSSFLLFLINDILDLAKLNAEMMTIENRPFNLVRMIKQISNIYGSSFAVNSNANFNLILSPELPNFIVSDEKRIEQVIANLLSNAFKFTDKGTVTFTVQPDEARKLIEFRVEDSGIGIAPEQLESMFSAFTQADSSISRKYGGTGLGLRIASKIIELMGGHISANSTKGEGSNFYFTIPLIEASDQEIISTSPSEDLDLSSLSNLSVVVVDDNHVNLKVINGLLKKLDVNTTAFSGAKEAIDFCMSNTIDIVIMDVQMPEFDGLSATKYLRENGFKQPIIAFTANSSEEDRISCFEAGMNDLLIKPIKLQNLSHVLSKWN